MPVFLVQIFGCDVDDKCLHHETEYELQEAESCHQPVGMQSSQDDRRYPCGMEQQAAESFESQDPALCAVVEAGGGGIAYLLFAPVFGAEQGLHTDNGCRIGFHAGVVPAGYLVDEEVVVAAAQVQVGGEAFLVEEELLAVGQVAADAHVGTASQIDAQIAHGGVQSVEGGSAVEPATAAFVAAVAQHYLGA